MKVKFKLVYGYAKDQFAPVSHAELPKLYVMFLTGSGRTILESGHAIKATDIIRIEPDWNATMGYFPDYTLRGDDWDEIGERRQQKAREIAQNVKQYAYHLIQTNQQAKASQPMKAIKSDMQELGLLPKQLQ